MVVSYEEIIMKARYLNLLQLQNKVVRIINDVPLRDSITPHYFNLALLKFRDIVKLYSFIYV